MHSFWFVIKEETRSRSNWTTFINDKNHGSYTKISNIFEPIDRKSQNLFGKPIDRVTEITKSVWRTHGQKSKNMFQKPIDKNHKICLESPLIEITTSSKPLTESITKISNHVPKSSYKIPHENLQPCYTIRWLWFYSFKNM